jgi:hypothetical protein
MGLRFSCGENNIRLPERLQIAGYRLILRDVAGVRLSDIPGCHMSTALLARPIFNLTTRYGPAPKKDIELNFSTSYH